MENITQVGCRVANNNSKNHSVTSKEPCPILSGSSFADKKNGLKKLKVVYFVIQIYKAYFLIIALMQKFLPIEQSINNFILN